VYRLTERGQNYLEGIESRLRGVTGSSGLGLSDSDRIFWRLARDKSALKMVLFEAGWGKEAGVNNALYWLGEFERRGLIEEVE